MEGGRREGVRERREGVKGRSEGVRGRRIGEGGSRVRLVLTGIELNVRDNN